MPLLTGCVAVLGVDVDATGYVTGKKVVYEHPAGMNYGSLVATHMTGALFVPGFQNGKPTACHFNWTLIFAGGKKRTGTG